eukprot:895076-Prorocentrum_minimum.AAC.2
MVTAGGVEGTTRPHGFWYFCRAEPYERTPGWTPVPIVTGFPALTHYVTAEWGVPNYGAPDRVHGHGCPSGAHNF